jgi:hypothetical protein
LQRGAKAARSDPVPQRREGRGDEPAAPELPAERIGEAGARGHGAGGEEGERDSRSAASEPDWSEPEVDPIFRALAHPGPRLAAAAAEAPAPAPAIAQLEMLLTRLVKRAAWGGDGRKGTARLELGAGPLEGATLLVQADGGELSIDLELPPGAATEEWRERLLGRLTARGLVVRELTVR